MYSERYSLRGRQAHGRRRARRRASAWKALVKHTRTGAGKGLTPVPAASILVSPKNGRSRKLFSRSRAMTAPSASTVTRRRSAAARAARVRARASLRHHLASSSSSPRSTTSCAPCRATTTMRTRAVRASSLVLQGLCVFCANKKEH